MSSPISAPSRSGTSVWEIDPVHSSVNFSVRHVMVSNVRGEFTKLSGTVVLDAEDITRSRVRATIDAASVNTREPQRDEHLRSPDFLDTARFPTIEFSSTKLSPRGEGTLELTGDLTIHGITRQVLLQVESDGIELKDPFGNLKRGASATAKINRKDFDLQWNMALEAGGFVVGDEIKIVIDVELVKQADE
jgi:polyisoprenoid-binding protein YceI